MISSPESLPERHKHCSIILKLTEMKKVVLSLAVLFSVAMVACNGNKQAEAVDSESIRAAEAVEVVDTTGDTAAAAAVEAVTPAGDTVNAAAAETVEAPAAQ